MLFNPSDCVQAKYLGPVSRMMRGLLLGLGLSFIDMAGDAYRQPVFMVLPPVRAQDGLGSRTEGS